ncbi:MAG: PQQ-dependent sugar dehydrogenase [Planctomycetota bacterium]
MASALLLPSLVLITAVACGTPADAWQEPEANSTPDATQTLALEVVRTDLKSPVFLCSAPDDSSRLFILEQAGRLRMLINGEFDDHDLIDLTAKISSISERGLLGMAWHPRFPQMPYVYLHYSNTEGDTIISRFTVDSEQWIADPESEKLLLQVKQPWSNHNGGMIAFGPNDGFLYIGLGDGGAANDPHDAAQNGQNLLGKILRIDVDQGDPYAIPKSNPFVGNDQFRDEIWAYGMRNPWRFCFDPVNGDLYIGDVGQNKWEELDWQSGASKGGENYGWRIEEGTHAFKGSDFETDAALVQPIHEYGHTGGHCSVTGGYVYRGEQIPWLQGQYFYADYCSGAVGTLKVKDGVLLERTNRTKQLSADSRLTTLVCFGVDADQEMYIVCQDGRIFRIIAGA